MEIPSVSDIVAFQAKIKTCQTEKVRLQLINQINDLKRNPLENCVKLYESDIEKIEDIKIFLLEFIAKGYTVVPCYNPYGQNFYELYWK